MGRICTAEWNGEQEQSIAARQVSWHMVEEREG